MRRIRLRAKAELAKQLLKHPVDGTRALVRARQVKRMARVRAGVMALGALVAVPVGVMAYRRARAR
jgi:hypothetical protein